MVVLVGFVHQELEDVSISRVFESQKQRETEEDPQ